MASTTANDTNGGYKAPLRSGSLRQSFRSSGRTARRTMSDLSRLMSQPSTSSASPSSNGHHEGPRESVDTVQPSLYSSTGLASTSEKPDWATPSWMKEGGPLEKLKRSLHKKSRSESSVSSTLVESPTDDHPPRSPSNLGLYTSQLGSSMRAKFGRRGSTMDAEVEPYSPVEASSTRPRATSRPSDWLFHTRKSSRPSLFDQLTSGATANAASTQRATPPRQGSPPPMDTPTSLPPPVARQDSTTSDVSEAANRDVSATPSRIPIPPPQLSVDLLRHDDWGELLGGARTPYSELDESRPLSLQSESQSEAEIVEAVRVVPQAGQLLPTPAVSPGLHLGSLANFKAPAVTDDIARPVVPAAMLPPPLPTIKAKGPAFDSLPTPPPRARASRESIQGPPPSTAGASASIRQSISPASWTALSLSASEMATATRTTGDGAVASSSPELLASPKSDHTLDRDLPPTPSSETTADGEGAVEVKGEAIGEHVPNGVTKVDEAMAKLRTDEAGTPGLDAAESGRSAASVVTPASLL